MTRPEDVLTFWYGRVPGPTFGLLDALWLPTRVPYWVGRWSSRVYDVDGIMARRFGEAHAEAAEGRYDRWVTTAPGRLALVLLLDQFSRNIHRGTPLAFAQDAKALPLALEAIEMGVDRAFHGVARAAFYLPLMHQEDLATQERCVELYERAYRQSSGLPRLILGIELVGGRRHRDIIARFGRFPHRNAILGRESTAEESAFLQEPLSHF
jgi:uncharacterized protein (DUF924 family)